MGAYSLIIEKLYDDLEDQGQQLKGLFCIQYPIYCIHANITDNTTDPLENLDKTIAEFYFHKPDFSAFQIASLMGTSKSLVELRVASMVADNLLVQSANKYELTSTGREVFREASLVRQHKLSYDFYIDGITFKPLPKIFYTYYSTRMISENDSIIRTSKKTGETYIAKPFGPDITHTPPDIQSISQSILQVDVSERSLFAIPSGLQTIEDIAFTKLSLQIFVAASSNSSGLKKQLIDPFAIYSLSENISYYEAVRRNVIIFEKALIDKITNLVFRILLPAPRTNSNGVQPVPVLTSNWLEIDKQKNAVDKCFLFSDDDLLKFIEHEFHMNHLSKSNIINKEADIGIDISKTMLFASPNRQKVISNLIRARDYKFGNQENNIFLVYFQYKTSDPFVQSVVEFTRLLSGSKRARITMEWIDMQAEQFSRNYRQLLIAAGELELLEMLDIEKHMIPL